LNYCFSRERFCFKLLVVVRGGPFAPGKIFDILKEITVKKFCLPKKFVFQKDTKSFHGNFLRN